MSDVLAVLLCRLFVTCVGVAVGIPDKGACSTAVAVASFVSLLVSLSPPVCPPPAVSLHCTTMSHGPNLRYLPGSYHEPKVGTTRAEKVSSLALCATSVR